MTATNKVQKTSSLVKKFKKDKNNFPSVAEILNNPGGFKGNLIVKPEKDTKLVKSRQIKTTQQQNPSPDQKNKESHLQGDEVPIKIAKTITAKKKSKAKSNYVLFVGNLPYTVSKDSVLRHFETAGEIEAVRLLTAKDTGKPKGFAFVQFANVKSFKQGLLLHHSKLGGRSINVEFTSIGGGKSKKRKEKLRQKNRTLERFKIFKVTKKKGEIRNH